MWVYMYVDHSSIIVNFHIIHLVCSFFFQTNKEKSKRVRTVIYICALFIIYTKKIITNICIYIHTRVRMDMYDSLTSRDARANPAR